LTVTPARESNVVEITFQGRSPEFVAAVANAFASEHQKMTLQLKVQPLKQASQYFTSQIKVLRENLEAAQGKLSKYQQEKGLVSVDNRLDVESSRLNDLSTQLVVVQGQLSDATSRRRQAQGVGANESPDIVSNPLVQNLKVSLAQAKAKLSEVGQRVYPNHPTYQAAKAEVDQLQAELKKTIEQTSSSVGNSAQILQRREAEVKAALAAQKVKILELNRDRDQLAVLMRDVDSAQRAYDTTMQRFSQTSLEGQSNQTDIAVLSQAMPPSKEVGPKIILNVLLSIFVGLILGVGAGLVSEMFDRRIRSERDLEDMQDTPVIRFADPIETASPSRFSVGLLRRQATN
jgi:succinoglycan biosynthesis transport protein ExoP